MGDQGAEYWPVLSVCSRNCQRPLWKVCTTLSRKNTKTNLNEICVKLQISASFLFSNIRKGRLLYIHPIGRSVGWCHHYFSFSTYILRIRTTVRDFTWSSLVVNSGQHCDCDYCQEIVKIVPELAEKRKEKRIFRQRWFVWGQHNYHTSCRWSVLIKKTFFKTKVSAVNMIRGIDF